MGSRRAHIRTNAGSLVGMGLHHEKDRECGERTMMSKNELQTILGYLNLGLAIAHSAGVSVGHFGDTDFLQLAQTVNGLLLNAISPAVTAAPTVASVAAPVAITS